MAVQWLGLGAFTAVGPGSIPGLGTKILQATWHSQKFKKKKIIMWKNLETKMFLSTPFLFSLNAVILNHGYTTKSAGDL